MAGLSYADEELVAETVSDLVCGSVGLNVSASSIPDLVTWAATAKPDTIERLATTIDGLARRIESALLDDAGAPRETAADRSVAVAA